MITYVNTANSGMYNTRFEQATISLRNNSVVDRGTSITTLEEYFLYLRDLAMIDPYYTMLPIDEETLDIDANTRKIRIPDSFAKNGVGVQGDEIAEVLYFTIDRFFDATDLSSPEMQIAIQWETADHIAGVSKEFVRDITSSPGKMIFGWPLASEITKKPGKVKFSVRFYTIDDRTVLADNGAKVTQQYLKYNFNTIPAELTINASLDYSLCGDEKLDIIDRENLIVNRIVNSVLTNPSIPDADSPVWRINLADIAAVDAIYADVYALPEETDEEKAAKNAARAAADAEAAAYLATDAAKAYLIKDLNKYPIYDTENSIIGYNYGYWMEAYATGNGAVSYNWFTADINPDGISASEQGKVKNVNNSYYVPAAEGRMDKTKSYYTAINAYATVHHDAIGNEGDDDYVPAYDAEEPVGISGYEPKAWFADNSDPTLGALIVDEIDGEGQHHSIVTTTSGRIELFERHSRALADAAGIYHVIAVNQRLGKRQTSDSYTLIFPMPSVPKIATETSDATVTVQGTEMNVLNDDGTTIHVLLNDEGEATLHVSAAAPEIAEAEEKGWPEPVVELAYQWFTDPNLGSAIYADKNINEQYKIAIPNPTDTYELAVTLPANGHFDQTFFAKVISTRNQSQAFKYSLPYRVTSAPTKPIVIEPQIPSGLNIRNYSVGDTIILGLDDSVQSDEYTYQWMRFNPTDNTSDEYGVVYEYGDDDFILEDEVDATFHPDTPGVYYCKVTNHLNAATNTVNTPFYNFQRDE